MSTSTAPVRVGVVGHVEVVDFALVERLPAPGEIVVAQDAFREAAGGAAITAAVLRELAGEALLLCAAGSDAESSWALRELRERRGVEVHAAVRDAPSSRAFAHVDAAGERAITVLGEPLAPRGADALPWDRLGALDGVFFAMGDAGALRAARRARVLVATPRHGRLLAKAGIALDALVGSAVDPSEALDPGALEPAPRLVVRTRGADGGEWIAADGARGTWRAATPRGEPVDAFGCGDAFAAGLTYGLAQGLGAQDACELGAREGARRATLRGPYGR